jgi:hypothetical protein
MYYVYQLVDPRNNQPFYIGKGKGRRAKTHLWEVPETRNVYKENKIAKIREEGKEPIIEYLVSDIIDEALAYDIETTIIKKYGRKGYDKNGTLTNICEDNRPPNHKGKTYEEIYGVERAKEQKALRARLQKERGGYGPKKHTAETKEKLKAAHVGRVYKKFSLAARQNMSKARNKWKTLGKDNILSNCYKLTSPAGAAHILWGGELKDFCKEHNLSLSTLKKQIHKNPWGVPKKGKTKGWKLEIKL